MRPAQRAFVVQLARKMLGDEQVDRILAMPFVDAGHGYDPFGQERETGLAAYLALRWLYTRYFRVESRGHEYIPAVGRAILAGNHSGLLPFDGIMVGIDLLERCNPPRAMRAIADHFFADIPFFGTFVYRAGQVIGTRENFEHLLNAEELVTVFPEGAKGIGKPFRERYRLRPFHTGFVEIALAHETPIIPFAVIGAEEQAPILFDLDKLGERLGLPFLPVTPTFPLLGPLGLFPYPVKYHIRYGEPLSFHHEYDPADAAMPEVTKTLAARVQQKVQQLVDDGLAEREGIFR